MMTFRNKLTTILLLAFFSSVTFVSCGKKSADTEQGAEEQPTDSTEHPEGGEHPEGEEHPSDTTQQQ